MENPEEVLHSLEEFSKMRPRDIPRELEDYLCFVAKTGDPIYQWSAIKSLFREKLINVVTEFYETCPSIDIPPCPNVDLFNYESMKSFILEKLDTFAAAPFTVQRICELLTSPRKEYNRIDKYMRALEKNILVVSTTEPGNRRSTENGDGIMNGLESEHLPETSNSSNDINVEEMDDTPSCPRITPVEAEVQPTANVTQHNIYKQTIIQETFFPDSRGAATCSTSVDTVITCQRTEENFVSIEPVPSNACRQDSLTESVSVTITAIPAGVQKRRNSIEPVVSTDSEEPERPTNEEAEPESNEAEEALKPEESKIETIQQSEDTNIDSTSQSQPEEVEQPETSVESSLSETDIVQSSSSSCESTENSCDSVEDSKQTNVTECETSTKTEDEKSERELPQSDEEISQNNEVITESKEEVIQRSEPEFEENSKDSEISSSSSVTSNESDKIPTEDIAKVTMEENIEPTEVIDESDVKSENNEAETISEIVEEKPEQPPQVEEIVSNESNESENEAASFEPAVSTMELQEKVDSTPMDVDVTSEKIDTEQPTEPESKESSEAAV